MGNGLGITIGALCVTIVVTTHIWARQAGIRRRVFASLVSLVAIAAVSVLYFTDLIGDRTFAITLLSSVIGTTVNDLVSGRRPGKSG